MFMTGLFPFKYTQFVLMVCLEEESWYLTWTGWQVFQYNSIGQRGKYNRQAIEIHDRMVSRWAEPQSGYTAVEDW